MTFIDQAPRADLPDQKKLRRRQRLIRWWVYVSIFVLPIVLLAYLSELRTGDDDLGVAETAQPQGASLAAATMERWAYGADPTIELSDSQERRRGGLTGAVVLGPTGFEASTTNVVVNRDQNLELSIEQHQFGVLYGGVVYNATVEITVTPDGIARHSGGPSLIPAPQDTTSTPDNWRWDGLGTSRIPEAVDDAIGRWADTFVGGTPVALKAITLDPNESGAYLPLQNMTLEDVNLDQNGVATDAGLVSRVTLTVVDAFDSTVSIELDVLTERSNTATPVVVAWGPPGSAFELTPYVNAQQIPARLNDATPAGNPTAGSDTPPATPALTEPTASTVSPTTAAPESTSPPQTTTPTTTPATTAAPETTVATPPPTAEPTTTPAPVDGE